MTWNEAINAGCHLAGVSYAELTRRLGMKSPTQLTRWRGADQVPSVVNFQRILDVLGLAGGYGADGWWVSRPEDAQSPKAAE